MGAPQAAGPVFVDETGQAFYPTAHNSGTFLVKFGAALYTYAYKKNSGGANINGSSVYKSTDGGSTWAELDGANAPTAATGSTFFDVAGNQLICGLVTETFPQSLQPIFLKNFSLLTETWGANYATSGAPSAFTNVVAVYLRPDASIVAFFDAGPFPTGSRLLAAVFATGAWGVTIDAGAAVLPFDPTGQVLVTGMVSTMEPLTGVIHLAYTSAGSNQMYQMFDADNSLGSSTHFTGTNISSGFFTGITIFGGKLYLSFPSNSFNNYSVLTGSPLTAPVWVQTDPAPMAYGGNLGNFVCQVLSDSHQLYYVATFLDATFTYVSFQIFTSPDGITWTIVPDNVTSPYFYSFAPGGSPQAPNTDATFGMSTGATGIISSGGTTTIYQFGDVHNSSTGANSAYFVNSEAFAFGSPLALADSPPAGHIGEAYHHCFIASGGTPPYVNYAITAGSLPPGLTLGATTGCVTGIPGPAPGAPVSSALGKFCFTVTVTDSAAATASVSACITIFGAVVIQLIGWKLYPVGCPVPLSEVPEVPHVKCAV